MTKQYAQMTRQQLVHEFCVRAPDLYMDLLQMAGGLGESDLVHVLLMMDLDAAQGKKGRLLRQPFTEEPP
jgi:hypothetical protein